MKYLNNTILATLFLFLAFSINAQLVQSAHLSEDGVYSIQEHRDFPVKSTSRLPFEQLDNFPFASQSHPVFRNVRNVSQADINGDNVDEILFCANETLFALDGNGSVIWSFDMEGTSNYPPAVGDMDDDNEIDIACQTYGIQPNVGNVYLFDKSGNLFPNFPFNADNHFFLNAVTIDKSAEGAFLIASERVSSTEGKVHLLKADATSINENFPVTLGGTPAITPTSVTSSTSEPYLILTSTTEMYITDLNGEFINGSPFAFEGSKFSYQSPLSLNVQESNDRFIVGSMHGDSPNNYVIDEDGNPFASWPYVDDSWTYAPPSFYDNPDSEPVEIYFNRPYVNEDEEGAILLGFDASGQALPNFPIMGNAGSEGLVTIGDIDGDGDQELISPSKITVDGQGMINAYHIESGELVNGFPIMVEGFTFMNGAYLGDVNGDGQLDLTALSYQMKFNSASPDSVFINVFDMEIPYDESTISFNGYKGSTSHNGFFNQDFVGTQTLPSFPLSISPNPTSSFIQIEADIDVINMPFKILNMEGIIVQNGKLESNTLNIIDLPSGKYQIQIIGDGKLYTESFIKIE